MTCKKEGLILLHHNDLLLEWQELCVQTLSPSAVSDKPLIHNGQGFQEGGAGVQHTERFGVMSQLMGFGLAGRWRYLIFGFWIRSRSVF
jgi:hypothetical protein